MPERPRNYLLLFAASPSSCASSSPSLSFSAPLFHPLRAGSRGANTPPCAGGTPLVASFGSMNKSKSLTLTVSPSRSKSQIRLNLPDVRWFVMGDDDTVFFTDNLVKVLSKYDHEQMWYIGGSSESVEQNVMHGYDMAFGGGGFAISRPLAAPLAAAIDCCLQRYFYYYRSDPRIATYVSEIRVPFTVEHGFHQVTFSATHVSHILYLCYLHARVSTVLDAELIASARDFVMLVGQLSKILLLDHMRKKRKKNISVLMNIYFNSIVFITTITCSGSTKVPTSCFVPYITQNNTDNTTVLRF
ncbi:unnamed protein product [Brassica oleracea]|nr:unnamed protein product [Brassica napus]